MNNVFGFLNPGVAREPSGRLGHEGDRQEAERGHEGAPKVDVVPPTIHPRDERQRQAVEMHQQVVAHVGEATVRFAEVLDPEVVPRDPGEHDDGAVYQAEQQIQPVIVD